MGEELLFPANDAFSLINDLHPDMMNEEVLANDINPSFPQPEVINIPEIIPPTISPKEPTKTFSQPANPSYAPISQLMKQTEELTSTLEGPLVANSNINEQIKYNHMQSNSSIQDPIIGQHMQNPMVNNNINFVSPASHISPMQNANSQCLVIRGQRIPITPPQHNSSVINIKPAQNASAPLIQTCTVHSMHSSSVINASNNLKQTMMVKAPQNQTPTTQNANKAPMKGQIIKTPDQRLMFVTEVNGRRVGYLIQQPKQPNVAQAIVPAQTPTPNILNQHFDNTSNQESCNVNIHNENTEAINLNNHKASSSEAINFTLDENKEIITPPSATKEQSRPEPFLKTDMKSLREKLLNLRNPLNLKNQTNIKSPPLAFPSMNKPVEEKLDYNNTFNTPNEPEIHTDLINEQTITASSPSHSPQSPEKSPSSELLSQNDKEENYQNEEEEDAQELDFSENDLIADFDDNPTDQSCSPDYEMGEGDVHNNEMNSDRSTLRTRLMSTDDEDCVPLAMLKSDTNEGSLSPCEEKPEPVVPPPKKVKSKKAKHKGDPLNETSKKKSKTKAKKKKDPRKPPRPIIAYQLFFREVQHEIREQNPHLNFGEISKEVSKKWDVLDEEEKKKYRDAHEGAKVEFAVKMKAYNELLEMEKEKAGESISPEEPASPEFQSSSDVHATSEERLILAEVDSAGKAEEIPKKKPKKAGKAKKSKKSPEKKKGVSEGKEDAVKSISRIVEGEQTSLTVKVVGLKEKKLKAQKAQKSNGKQQDLDNPPSSPSLPSSASSTDEEDSETAITRIREKAAELHKYLKQQRFSVTKKKTSRKSRPNKSLETVTTPSDDENAAEETKKTELDAPVDAEIETKSMDIQEMHSEIMVKEELEDAKDEDTVIDHEIGDTEVKDTEMEVDMKDTEFEDEVKDAEFEDEVKDAELEDEVKDTGIEDEGKDAVIEDEVRDTEMEDEVKNKEMEEEVKYEEIEEEVKYKEMEEEVKYTEMEDEVNDAEFEDEEKDTEIEDEVRDTQIEDEVKDTEMEFEVKDAESDDEVRSERRAKPKKRFSKEDKDSDDSSDDEEQLEKCFQNLRRKKSPRLRKIEETAKKEKEKNSKSKKPKANDKSPRKRKSLRKVKTKETMQSESDEEASAKSEEMLSENHASEMREPPEESDEDSSQETCSMLKADPAEERETASVEEEIPITTSEETSETGELAPSEPMKNTGFRIPKKSQSGTTNENGMLFRGPRICVRQSCENPAVTSRERGGQYCGNDCLVLYCREVFNSWVIDRQLEEQNKT